VHHKGEHLGEQGGTIVAETIIFWFGITTIHICISGSTGRQSGEKIGLRKDFDMAALIKFVEVADAICVESAVDRVVACRRAHASDTNICLDFKPIS